MRQLTVVLSVLLASHVAFSATIYVPDRYSTIQDAINASVNGDTVIVRPGTYVEDIDFLGKDITVKSEGGPALTRLEGNHVNIVNGDCSRAFFEGFAVTDGGASAGRGNGCSGSGQSPAKGSLINLVNKSSAEPVVENVFIIVIDGLRNSEGFKDPTHQYLPRLWTYLRPLGTLYNNFYGLGKKVTTPGHAAITTGVMQWIHCKQLSGCDTDVMQNNPSIFQYYRSQLGVPQDKTWMICGKGGQMSYVDCCLNPAYKDTFAPSVAFKDIHVPDSAVWTKSKTEIFNNYPSLTLINFSDVDSIAHLGNWNDYVQAIKDADYFVYDLCETILQDPHYKNNTAIFITSDHGRHLPKISTGFKDHGCNCLGCREVPFLAIGPGIRKNAWVDKPGYLRDIAPTVAYLLGFEANYAHGRVLTEMFVSPPPVKAVSFTDPTLDCGNGKLHLAYVRRAGWRSKICYTMSANNGSTWSAPVTLGSFAVNLFPTIVVEGDRVCVVWSCVAPGGGWAGCGMESTDGGANWSNPLILEGSMRGIADIHPDACYHKGVLYLTWAEAIMEGYINVARVQNGMILKDGGGVSGYSLWPRIASFSDGIHLVFQRLSLSVANWNTNHVCYDGNGFSNPSPLLDTAEQSLRPDLVSDGSGLHTVWAERSNDNFRVVCTNSIDGKTWDATCVVGENTLGAWRPRITTNGSLLAVVWEGYDTINPAVFYAVSGDGGKTWSAPAQISGAGETNTFPSVTIDSGNLLHTVSMKGKTPFHLTYDSEQL